LTLSLHAALTIWMRLGDFGINPFLWLAPLGCGRLQLLFRFSRFKSRWNGFPFHHLLLSLRRPCLGFHWRFRPSLRGGRSPCGAGFGLREVAAFLRLLLPLGGKCKFPLLSLGLRTVFRC